MKEAESGAVVSADRDSASGGAEVQVPQEDDGYPD
jgi:hypothetical protein